MRDAILLALERERGRVWALCYRMTGSRADADDLAQDALAKAVARADQVTADDPTGWLLSLASRVCLDHLRRVKTTRRLTELVDPIEGGDWVIDSSSASAENALVRREDVRFAIMVALQSLSPKQRAAVILRDVCGQSLGEIAVTLGNSENAVKALLQRARATLADARGNHDVDVPVDRHVVERFARAIEAGSIEQLTELLAEDVWGLVDGGGLVVTASKPTFGRRAVSRQWANAKRKLDVPVLAEVRPFNGEPAIVVRLRGAPEVIVAIVHIETRGGSVKALRTLRDPTRIARCVISP